MSHTKMYVCDTWDDLCDIGEHTIDHRCYRSRKDAELRASRLTYDDEGVRNYAMVVELDACWAPNENDKLKELVQDMWFGNLYYADGRCDWCRMGCDDDEPCSFWMRMRELGIGDNL